MTTDDNDPSWPTEGAGAVWGAYRLDTDGWWRLRPCEPPFVACKCLVLLYLFLVCTVLWPLDKLWYWWKYDRKMTAPIEREKRGRGFGAANGLEDLHPRTLEAKYLDPECWDGCQSQTLKARCERYEKLLRRVLEWCEHDSPHFEIDADAIRTALDPHNERS